MTVALPLRAAVPGAVRAEIRELGGRQVVLVRVDADERRGALSPDAAATLTAAAEAALETRRPFVAVMASSGADVHAGVEALHGWGRAARALARCSGVVPILFAVTGPTVSGPALLLGVADVVVMVEGARAFLSGPSMVADFTGVRVDAAELGGSGVHARSSGLAAAVVPDEAAALDLLGAVLSHLPDHADDLPPEWPTGDPVDRPTPELRDVLPSTSSGSYDVRDVVRAVADEGALLELWGAWAPNLVTALVGIGGRPVGVVANQPLAIAGTLDIPSSQKGARFVALCDAFNLPLLTLVDTPGFFPGKDLEWRGMIRHGASLAHAYAAATVPRVCLVLRKAYGGAYIVMDSKRMGGDLTLAWPTAEVAVMGAKGAVEILHRRATPEERLAREAEFEATSLTPYVAAERGLVDAVIDPADTRAEVTAAFELLATKRELLPHRLHDNLPL
jgi:acetyl-CoA carboxylase carboxyltransferase component